MFKFFLVGWVCFGTGINEQCIRMGSEVINNTYEECNQYFLLVKEDLSNIPGIKLNLECVKAGLIEDVI